MPKPPHSGWFDSTSFNFQGFFWSFWYRLGPFLRTSSLILNPIVRKNTIMGRLTWGNAAYKLLFVMWMKLPYEERYWSSNTIRVYAPVHHNNGIVVAVPVQTLTAAITVPYIFPFHSYPAARTSGKCSVLSGIIHHLFHRHRFPIAYSFIQLSFIRTYV